MAENLKETEISIALTKVKDEKIKKKELRIKKVIIFTVVLFATLIIGSLFTLKTTKFINLDDLSSVNNADTGFMIISSILVMLMTPALACFTEEWFARKMSWVQLCRVLWH